MSSNKPLADSVGHLEYVLLGLMFLGVLYLVMKQAKINVSASGFQNQSAGVLGYMTDTTGATHLGSRPREGFSMGGFEPPAFHATPYDPSELNKSAGWDVNAKLDDEDWSGAAKAKRDGLVAGYSKVRHNSMTNMDLAKSMAGQ